MLALGLSVLQGTGQDQLPPWVCGSGSDDLCEQTCECVHQLVTNTIYCTCEYDYYPGRTSPEPTEVPPRKAKPRNGGG